MTIPAIEVKDLNRTFKTKAVKKKAKAEIVDALKDVNLTINE